VNTHLEVSEIDHDSFAVKAVQGQVVTRHTIGVNADFRDQFALGEIDGTTVIQEVVEILVEHEALAAVPADARLEQLVSHYPYLASELQQRLSSGSVEFPRVKAPRVDHLPADDRPTHI
jgi:hypothetical protein